MSSSRLGSSSSPGADRVHGRKAKTSMAIGARTIAAELRVAIYETAGKQVLLNRIGWAIQQELQTSQISSSELKGHKPHRTPEIVTKPKTFKKSTNIQKHPNTLSHNFGISPGNPIHSQCQNIAGKKLESWVWDTAEKSPESASRTSLPSAMRHFRPMAYVLCLLSWCILEILGTS